MLPFIILAIPLLSQTRAEDCAECSTFTWDNCYWDWEAQWNECSWVWEEDNGVEPYDKKCVEELASNQKDCLDAAGCFQSKNDDCWYNNYVFGCYLYNCEQYTLCYQSYQMGCNETRDFCEQSCGVVTEGGDDSYSYSMSFENEDYEPWYTDDPDGSAGYDYSYGEDSYSYGGYSDYDDGGYSDHYNEYDSYGDFDDSYNYNSDDYGDDYNQYNDYGQCSDGYCSDYGSYNDNYGDYDDCDCGDGIHYDCCDYGYDSYSYGGYYDYYQDQEPWEYCYDEVPECVKENCNSLLLTCAGQENCVSAIEQFVEECGNSEDPPVCIEDLFINTAEENGADQRIENFCNGDSQCVNDIKALGECVVNNGCHRGEDKLVKKRLNTLVKGLKKLRKQKLRLKLERGKEARIKSAKRKLAKRKLIRKQQRRRSTGRRSRRKLVSGRRGRRGERVRLRRNRRSRERVHRQRSKQQKLRGNRGKRVRASRRNRQREVRGRKVYLGELSSKQRDALKKQTTVFSRERRRYYQERSKENRPNPTPAHLQRERGVPKRKRQIKKRESSLRNAARSE